MSAEKPRWKREQFAAREAAQKDHYQRYAMKPAPIKAWAVVDKDGNIEHRDMNQFLVYDERDEADENCWASCAETVIPILITPLSESGEKK